MTSSKTDVSYTLNAYLHGDSIGTDDGQRTTDDGRRTMDNGRRMTDNGQRTTDDGQRTMMSTMANGRQREILIIYLDEVCASFILVLVVQIVHTKSLD
jgi:hypothetical protein